MATVRVVVEKNIKDVVENDQMLGRKILPTDREITYTLLSKPCVQILLK